MNMELNNLFQEVLKRQEKDYDTLLTYYIDLIKKRKIKNSDIELSNINEAFKKDENKNILSLWIHIRFNNDKVILNNIERDITNKFNEINNSYREYFRNSKFYLKLKEEIVNILAANKYGLTFDEIVNVIDIKYLSNNSINNIIDELIKDGKVSTLEGKQPRTYYLK